MERPMKVVSLDKALKLWGLGLVAVVVMYFGGQFSESIAGGHGSSALLKWTAVAIAVACMIPWLLFIAWTVSLVDEYHRHVALIGTAAAFVVDALVHVAFNVMQTAQIVSWSSHLLELPVGMLVWVTCVGIAAIYYRMRL
jgi:hypothetical protein